jgi:hypothetical protein
MPAPVVEHVAQLPVTSQRPLRPPVVVHAEPLGQATAPSDASVPASPPELDPPELEAPELEPPLLLPASAPELEPPLLLVLPASPPELELVVPSPAASPPELLELESVLVSAPESPPELELVVASPASPELDPLEPDAPLDPPELAPLLLVEPLLAPSSDASEPLSSSWFEEVVPPPPHPATFTATLQPSSQLNAIQPRTDPLLMGTPPPCGRAHRARTAKLKVSFSVRADRALATENLPLSSSAGWEGMRRLAPRRLRARRARQAN